MPLPLLRGAFCVVAWSLTVLSPLAARAASSPTSYFPAEDSPTDIAVAHRDATVPLTASAHYGPGKVGEGFHFEDTYIDFGDWFTYQSFAVAMWIRDSSTTQAPQADALTLAENHGSLGLIWKITYQAASSTYVYSSGDGGAPVSFTLPSAAWHYLVISRDGASKVTTIYLDGQVAGSAQGASDLDYDFISGMRFGADFGLTQYWKGDIDELAFYDRALGAAEVALLSAAGVDLSVGGRSNPYLAGMPEGSTDSGSDAVPAESPQLVTGIALGAGQRLQICAAGGVNNAGSLPTEAPDGTSTYTRVASNGISGANYPINALVGVFLGSEQPDASPAPETFDSFAVPGGLSYSSVSPGLKQVFFIGDGRTAENALQDVIVPAGATRLYLGTSDGFGWYNNSGSFSVHVVNADEAGGGGGTELSATSLTVNGSTTPSTVAPGNAIHFAVTQTSTATGLTVRMQSSSTPDVEASWTDLNDGNGGKLTSAGGGQYTLDSAAYPAGSAVSFRAISVAPGQIDSISNIVGPFDLKQAELHIALGTTSTSDPLGRAARIGDQITYKLTFSNFGAAEAKNLQVRMTIPHYRKTTQLDSSNQEHQFEDADLSISPGGSIYLTGNTAPDGTPERGIVWDVGNLAGGFQQFVTFTVSVTNAVRVPSAITSNDTYSVSSTTNQPSVGADRISSGELPISIDVRGPIKLTAVAGAAQVAPGGLFYFDLALTNLGGAFAKYPAIAVDVPAFSRFFSASYLDKNGKPLKKAPVGAHEAVEIDPVNGTNQVLILAGKLNAGAAVTVRITFQAQWVDPAEAPKISTIDYAAGFIDPTNTAAVKNFLNGDVKDAIAFLSDATTSTASTKNDSGVVAINLSGDLSKQPKLALFKTIGDLSATSADDIHTADSGDGELLNTVEPGSQVTFALVVLNEGDSAAEDVYVQDRLPEGTVLVTAGKKAKELSSASKPDDLAKAITPAFKSESSSASNKTIAVSLEADGRTLRISGLHLAAHDAIGLTYTVQALTIGDTAPAVGSIIIGGASSVGSSSTPHTAFGFPAEVPVKVVGNASFGFVVQPQVPKPGVSSDVVNTANAITAIYNHDPSRVPEVGNFNPPELQGDERYLIHYYNSGGVAASDVKLVVPLPPNAAFYRAAFVKKGKLTSAPHGASVSTPDFLATSGDVTFSFNRLNGEADGEVIVEVIILESALNQNRGSFGSIEGITMRTSQAAADRERGGIAFEATAPPQVAPVSGVQLGILDSVPTTVVAGSTFHVFISIFNNGTVPVESPTIFWTLPLGAEVINFEFGQGQRQNPREDNPIKTFTFRMASNNGPVGATWSLQPHTGAIVHAILMATGPAGSSIQYGFGMSRAYGSFVGMVNAAPKATQIVAPNPLQSPSNATITTITGANFVNLADGGVIVPLGGGNIVAFGAGNIVTSGAGNIVASGAGNLVVSGASNLVTLNGVAGLGTATAAAVLTSLPSIVQRMGANIWNGPATNLIGNDGASLISNDGASVIGTIPAIVASGAGNIVATGGGNLISNDGAGVAAQGGGNMQLSGGGNIITFGGGIVSTSGSGLNAQGGRSLEASLTSSSAIVATGGGNIVSSGGGNIQPNQ